MGLTIIAYSNLHRVADNDALDSDGDVIDSDKHVKAFINRDFRNSAPEWEDGKAYTYDDTWCFSAGPYTSYGHWRDALETLCDNCHNGAFHELIHFSDCEGDIGPSIATKLLADFVEYRAKARCSGDKYFLEKYENWIKALKIASKNGLLKLM